MRIVTIGCPVPHRDVDNHGIANAPSLFDYDACVIDLQALSDQIEAIAAGSGGYKASDGRPVRNAGTTPSAYGLAELLEQRRFELRALVERGGAILAFAHQNLPHPSVAGLPGFERYALLPAPEGAEHPFRWPKLRPADGMHVQPADERHPAAGFLDALAGRIRYRAVLDPDAPGAPPMTILARSAGGAAVAAELRVAAGRLLLLPTVDGLTPATRQTFTNAILELLQRLHDGEGGGDPPNWIARYDTDEIAQARRAAAEAEAGLAEAERRAAETAALLADVSSSQSLLWRADRAGFESAVLDGFRALGYAVASRPDEPAELRDGDQPTLIEAVAADDAVSERAYLSLQRRIEEHFLKRGVRPHGVIVASGKRLTDPRLRRNQFAAPLVNACETFGYALIPADAFYDLVAFAREDPDPDGLAELRQSIRETRGVLEVSPEEEEDDPGGSPASNGAAAEAPEPAEPELAEPEAAEPEPEAAPAT